MLADLRYTRAEARKNNITSAKTILFHLIIAFVHPILSGNFPVYQVKENEF